MTAAARIESRPSQHINHRNLLIRQAFDDLIRNPTFLSLSVTMPSVMVAFVYLCPFQRALEVKVNKCMQCFFVCICFRKKTSLLILTFLQDVMMEVYYEIFRKTRLIPNMPQLRRKKVSCHKVDCL